MESSVGFIFIFNLIVGAGALTIPHAFSQIGLIYGTLGISFLAFTSYLTATYTVELVAGMNALEGYDETRKLNHGETKTKKDLPSIHVVHSSTIEMDDDEDNDEDIPLLFPAEKFIKGEKEDPLLKEGTTDGLVFHLNQKIEFTHMAQRLYGANGLLAFSICVIVYLYGDLAIYAVAVPKSLREITCPRPSMDSSVPWTCGRMYLNSSQLYRLYVLLFSCCIGPFVFGNTQKTRGIQIVSGISRQISFLAMIVIPLIGIVVEHQGRATTEVWAYEAPQQLPTFFGVCIYSFMCHHSLPGLITPIRNKRHIPRVIAAVFALVLLLYLALCITATFRFHPQDIHDVYTLNFKSYSVRSVAYFLSFFPVFTLSANFPVIAITLRENLKLLLAHSSRSSSSELQSRYKHHMYSFLAIGPPIFTAFCTENVALLVGLTGAYAGLGIQWIIPSTLVFCLRRELETIITKDQNPFRSPFSHRYWITFILSCAYAMIFLVTMSHIFADVLLLHLSSGGPTQAQDL